MKPDTQLAYRPDVDGLRGIAILAVLAYHGFPVWARGGYVGVDVFFVVSGYLISGIILKDLGRGRFSYRNFYTRRIRRIFPALAVVLAPCMLFGWLALFPDEFRALGKHVAAGAGFVSNVALWQESGYFDTAADLKPLLHLWSLGVEEQYYIFWPLVLAAVFSRKRWVLPFITVTLLTSFILNVLLIGPAPSATFYLPFTRLWELMLGSALAYLAVAEGGLTHFLAQRLGPDAGPRAEARFADAFAWCGLALIGLGIVVITEETPFPGWWALLPTVGTLLCVAAGPGAWLNRVVLGNRVLVLIGLISYPLYLWHWPMFSFAHIIEAGMPPREVRIAILGVSMLLAWLTYRFVEQPIRFGRFRQKGPAPLALAVALVGAVGFVTYRANGFPARMSAPSMATADLETDPFAYRRQYRACDADLTAGASFSFCYVSEPGAPTRAIIGDSHAETLFPGIAKTDSGRSWLVIGEDGCPPLLNTEVHRADLPNVCARKMGSALRLVARNPSIRTVALSAIGSFYVSEHGFAAEHTGRQDASNWRLAEPGAPANASRARIYEDGLERAVALLLGAGKSVVIYLNDPEIPFMPRDCIRRPLRPRPVVLRCAIAKQRVLKRQESFRNLVAAVKQRHPALRVFDPLPYLCDDSLCYVIKDGRFLYRDSHHLSTTGSSLLAGPFLVWLTQG